MFKKAVVVPGGVLHLLSRLMWSHRGQRLFSFQIFLLSVYLFLPHFLNYFKFIQTTFHYFLRYIFFHCWSPIWIWYTSPRFVCVCVSVMVCAFLYLPQHMKQFVKALLILACSLQLINHLCVWHLVIFWLGAKHGFYLVLDFSVLKKKKH